MTVEIWWVQKLFQEFPIHIPLEKIVKPGRLYVINGKLMDSTDQFVFQ